MIGAIKMYNEARGFGFIFGEDEEDYFFHISEFKGIMVPEWGQVVSFTDGCNEKGKIATDVHYEAADMNEYKEKLEELKKNEPKSIGLEIFESVMKLCYFFFY